jgi:putative ABC transport system permease protein
MVKYGCFVLGFLIAVKGEAMAGIEIDAVKLGGALGLMVLAIALSTWQKLGLEGSLAIATGRSILQLLVVGYLLEAVFAFRNPFLVLAVVAVMLTIATVVTRNQISKKIPYLLPTIGGSLLLSTALTVGYVNWVVLRPDPWYEPQNLIPLAGILLGNTMNAAAIAGDRFVSTLNGSQLEIETHLSLGATPQQATMQYRRDAIKAGLIPTINTMLVVGVVTLPGIFTGQVLGGASPLVAAGYQILILFMVAIGTLVTTILVVGGVNRQFFRAEGQLVRY